MAQASTRPPGVTAVVVLIVITAAVNVLTAILQILEGDSASLAWLVTVVALVIAAIYVILAKGIFDGRELARVMVAVATSLMIVGALTAMFTQPHLWLTLIVQVLLGALVLGMLYTDRATHFFTAKEA